jgi:sigma-54 dependent transcriptional regulator, acetoin dehydrogenase operon transcriptional activator AcoR
MWKRRQAAMRYRLCCTMAGTISDVFAHEVPRRAAQRQAVLYVALQVDDVAAAPSRHRLDGIEVVSFGRGERSAIRRDIDGSPGLVISIPDPVMSSNHGRLIQTDGVWCFEDPRSKNGSVVDGQRTRATRVEPGAIIQLGHTILLFEHARLGDQTALDVQAVPLAPPRAELVTLDAELGAIVADFERIAAMDVPILLLGETGTGKDIFARALHALSRRTGQLVAVNCGAIPSMLIESELFGHKKGAFSGASSDRLGHLRAADRGTLFLDEIGELSPNAQTALLRALQNREVVPVGESLPMPVDFRVISATHRDLSAMIQEDLFREDLYGRLLGITVALPPLRERRFDLGILVGTLLRRRDPQGRAHITPPAARSLFAYAWPRNIRELERALIGSLARSANGVIDVDHLPEEIAACGSPRGTASATVPTGAPSDPEDDALRAEIIAALVRHGGNVTAAAKQLGKHREQLHRWARRLGINLDSFRR